MSQKGSGTFLKSYERIVYGLILLCVVVLSFLNNTYVGSFLLYCFSYVFGMFSYVVLILVTLLGLFLVIKRKIPNIRIDFSGLGYFLLVIFGCLASSIEVDGLTIANSLTKYNEAFASVTEGFKIVSLTSIPSLNGGVVGYFVTSLFLTGLGKIGTYVFTYLFLVIASMLLLRKPFFYLVNFIKTCKINSKVKKVQEEKNKSEEDVKEEERKEEDADLGFNPFTIKASEPRKIPTVLKEDNQEKDEEVVEKEVSKEDFLNSPFARQEEITSSLNESKEDDYLPSKEEVLAMYEEEEEEEVEKIQNTYVVPKPSYLQEEEVEEKVEKVSKPLINPVKEPVKPAPVAPKVEESAETVNDDYILPSINLLEIRKDYDSFEINKRSAEEKIDIINSVFRKNQFRASVESYTIGPTVTRFNIRREPGVKVNQLSSLITELQVDLNGDLSVRVELVVRGKDTSGIEIANPKPSMVSFRDCFGEMMKSTSEKLAIPLGVDVDSNVITSTIDSFPHLLVCGTTGSGKSVFIHSIIMSLIMRNYPSELKFILIDPKKVEFSKYNGMPHLYCPIVDDAVKAVAVLKKLVAEMDRRYTLLNRACVGKISEYEEVRKSHPEMEKLPNIVCIIDEFADLMGQAPKEVDSLTQRIAQLARAAGIYLIIATQRPTVNCITGTIKANIPARIALSVTTAAESRIIIDEGGADTLVGKGDLLAKVPQYKMMIRLQSAYVSNQEIAAVVSYLKSKSKPCYNKDFLTFEEPKAEDASANFNNVGERALEDPLYNKVKEYVLETGACSTSAIQRMFGIGYSKAAFLLDGMEFEGYIKTTKNGRRIFVDDEE